MRTSIEAPISDAIQSLRKSGLIDELTMNNIERLCLPKIQEFVSEKKEFPSIDSIFGIVPSSTDGVQYQENLRAE